MRILLDESVPGRLGPLLLGHSYMTVQRRGWASIKNGKLLALAAGEFDVLLTADKGMEYQQNLASLPVSILIVLARSKRLENLASKTWPPLYQPSCLHLQISSREHCIKLLRDQTVRTGFELSERCQQALSRLKLRHHALPQDLHPGGLSRTLSVVNNYLDRVP